jgi:N-acetylglutamate synthase-like GNAT family acetyltransferase
MAPVLEAVHSVPSCAVAFPGAQETQVTPGVRAASLGAMTSGAAASVQITLLADRPDLIPAVGHMRWAEWGHWPESTSLADWVDVTRSESGRDELPVTFVAVEESGAAAGAVALGQYEPDERRDRSPWIMGMIVRPDLRGLAIGRLLLQTLTTSAAAEHGYQQFWVATGNDALGFYQACGWTAVESFDRPHEHVDILTLML